MLVLTSEYLPKCPHTVARAAMLQRWDRLTFLHWSYHIDVVQDLLPSDLEVDPYDGRAWVGLVPFFMEVRFPGTPHVPWLSRFPETNVRTYVRGPTGEPGVWFFSLDASRLAAVLTARLTYRVAYFWSEMSVSRSAQTIRYMTRRRWPGTGEARSEVTVEIGDRYRPDQLEEFDHYLTARWTLYGTWRRRLLMAHAEHPPWPLHQARVETYRDDLVAAAGLPPPTGDPVVHWSPGVDVRIGFPRRVRV